MAISRRRLLQATAASTLIAGCTGGGGDSNTTTSGDDTTTTGGDGGGGDGGGSETWRYGTSQEGSGAAAMGNAFSVLFEQHSDQVSISPQTTQGYIQNLRLMDQDRMEAMFAHTIVAHWAYNDAGPFEENPVSVEPVQGHPTNQVLNHHFLVKPGDGVEAVSDLGGKRAAIGAPGSSLGALAQDILEAEGVLGDVETVRMTFTEAKSAFRAGNIDAFFTGIINMRTNAASLEVWQTMDVDIATMSSGALDSLVETNAFFSRTTVDTSHPKWPAEMDTSHDTIDLPKIIAYGLLQRDLDEDLVYHSMKVFHENQAELGELNESLWGIGWGTVDIEGNEVDRWGLDGALIDVPFHPGAERYLSEIGHWNSDWQVA